MDLMRITSETIWHFTCDTCKNWWSISSMDGWKPKKLFCPHCGHQHSYTHEVMVAEFTDTLTKNLSQLNLDKNK